MDGPEPKPPPKKRGRPPGGKNRPKSPEVLAALEKLKKQAAVELIKERAKAKIKAKVRKKRAPTIPAAAKTQVVDDKSLCVKMMASTKTEIKAMADMIGMGVIGFRKKYYKELSNGHDYVYAAVSMKLVNSAIAGDMRAMLAWLRQFGGWEQVTRKELTGKNGEPISIRNLDGPSLITLVEALGEKSTAGRGRSRTPPQIEYDRDGATDLDAIPGTADEGFEQ